MYFGRMLLASFFLVIAFPQCEYPLKAFFCLLVLWLYQNRKTCQIIWETLPRDIKGIALLTDVQVRLKYHKLRNSTLPSFFDAVVKRRADKLALIDVATGREWTFAEAARFTNAVANYFYEQGFRKGDVVGLFSQNCPEYAMLSLGLARIGVITAMINSNLRLDTLAYSLRAATCTAVIVSESLCAAFRDVYLQGCFQNSLKVYVLGKGLAALPQVNLAEALDSASRDKPPPVSIDFSSTLFYIFTSGTTGLPKAARVTHARYFMMAYGCHRAYGITEKDRLYITMPMYHTAAGVVGVGQTLLCGSTSVIRNKFSASQFWADCVKYKCTVSQYIGEICRYLLMQPPSAFESQHHVRLMFGNGLRPQIWKDFVARFKVAQIGEFYGSTEGNTSLVNIDNKVGSCGFLTIYKFLQPLYPVWLIKVDETTGEVVRDSSGLCVRCEMGEYGEIVGSVIQGNAVKEFPGYLSRKDTERKIIRNVFKYGDLAYCSGDILYFDDHAYLYFKDRIGDSFRWKGENVSSSEVEGVVQRISGLRDALVYGVEIPGTEGRAGMLAVVDAKQTINVAEFYSQLSSCLPRYAIPVFIRFCQEVETTGTYKLKKTSLQQEGYDLKKCGQDSVYYLNPMTSVYELLSSDIYTAVQNGELKL